MKAGVIKLPICIEAAFCLPTIFKWALMTNPVLSVQSNPTHNPAMNSNIGIIMSHSKPGSNLGKEYWLLLRWTPLPHISNHVQIFRMKSRKGHHSPKIISWPLPFSFGFCLEWSWISCSKNFFLSRNEGRSSSLAVVVEEDGVAVVVAAVEGGCWVVGEVWKTKKYTRYSEEFQHLI